MLLGAPEPKSQAHLPKWHVVQHKTHFWDHHSQTQPLEQPWALPESRTPEAEQPHFIPNPQAPLPKLVVTSGGIGGRGGVSPSAGAKQKLMQSWCQADALCRTCIFPATHGTAATGWSINTEPNTKSLLFSGGHGRIWGDSPVGLMPRFPLPTVNRGRN